MEHQVKINNIPRPATATGSGASVVPSPSALVDAATAREMREKDARLFAAENTLGLHRTVNKGDYTARLAEMHIRYAPRPETAFTRARDRLAMRLALLMFLRETVAEWKKAERRTRPRSRAQLPRPTGRRFA